MSDNSISDMPELPKNAKYIHHKNECFDWGTFGWAISTKQVELARYRYIVFLNSSVRGPFVPPYWPVRLYSIACSPDITAVSWGYIVLFRRILWQNRTCCRLSKVSHCILTARRQMQASIHWTSIYTQRLGSKVKLVGSTINCQPVWWRSDPSKEMRHNPHVQSYVMATDQVT